MEPVNTNDCGCCEHCAMRPYCQNGIINFEAIKMTVVEQGSHLATVRVRIGPTEEFDCVLRLTEGKYAIPLPEQISFFPMDLLKDLFYLIVGQWQNFQLDRDCGEAAE